MRTEPVCRSAVALVHGFPDGPESWTACSQIIRDTGRVTYRPALPGYRRTPGAPAHQEFTSLALGQEIAEQLWPTGDRPRAGMHLVGHDWGGVAAWMMTRCHDELSRPILSLTIIGTPHPCALHAHFRAPHSGYARALARPLLPELWLRLKSYEPLVAPLRAAGMDLPALERVREHCGVAGNLRRMLAPYRALARSASIPSFDTKVPTLLLRGENDPYVAAEHMLPRGAERHDLPVETLPGMGHWPQLQAPEALAARLLSFWADVESRT